MTRAEQLAELQEDRVRLRAAIVAAQGGVASMSVDGMSVTNRGIADLRRELTAVDKSIQRLTRGGRGMPIDMSYAAGGVSNGTPVFVGASVGGTYG